ncbi:polyprenyl synthetase family protein [Bacteriovoracaceae bacterium]|nr:polyprenyl synthetase family protein [Bacteriovoracaceae bacterium]|tara:strand:- start:170435 stop:171385 length:951 start_codon:yes stop_codon:yes gene_type:complete
MNLQELSVFANQSLKENLLLGLPKHEFSEAYGYAVLPPGKLFRPLLCLASAIDYDIDGRFESRKNSIGKLSSALEIHHSYTLVHDDLPAMDNDDYRRGKESTHKKYGQWQAILVGDGLLNHSYYLIHDLETTNDRLIRKFFSWALGSKGLIQGQYLDLSHEMNHSFEDLIETHNLKTARLIQTSLISGMLMSVDDEPKAINMAYKLFRFGRQLGILFQLIDDLTELTEDINQHEKDINPWLHQREKSQSYYEKSLKGVENFLMSQNTPTLSIITQQYLEKQKTTLLNGWSSMETYQFNKDSLLNPIMGVLNSLSSR